MQVCIILLCTVACPGGTALCLLEWTSYQHSLGLTSVYAEWCVYVRIISTHALRLTY